MSDADLDNVAAAERQLDLAAEAMDDATAQYHLAAAQALATLALNKQLARIADRLEQNDGPCPGCGHQLHAFDACSSCSCTDLPRGAVR